jgi:hypothetical protein
MRKTSSRLAPLVVLAALAAGVPARPAFAQAQYSAGDVAQARELFNQAMSQRDRGDAPGALEKFRAAHALAETPITGLELGRTYITLGKLVEARETLLSVGRIATQSAETGRSSAARKESADLAERLRPRIPSLTVRIAGVAADSVAVTIDGAAVPTEALIAPRLVNPGAHKVVATSTSGGSAETTVDLKEGETRDVELKLVLTSGTTPAVVVPPPTPATPAAEQPALTPETHAASGGWNPLVYAGFGTAVAGVAVGSVTGLLSLSKASSVKSACDGTLCPRSIDSDLQSGRTLGTVSTIAFVVGGAGLAAGVVGLLITPHKESPPAATTSSVTPWIGPGSAGLAGRF